MTKLSQYIGKYIDEFFTKYVDKIVDEYALDRNELQRIFNECIEKENGKKETVEVRGDVTNLCEYTYLRGNKQGTTCTSKKKNGQFCAKHMPKEEKKEKPKEPKEKGTKEEEPKVLKKNKIIDKWWHEKTKLVFKSDQDKIVFATYKNNVLADLTEDDIKLCQQYGFKYDVPVKEPLQKKQKREDEINTLNKSAKDVEYYIKNMIEKDEEEDEEEEEEVVEEEVVEEEEVEIRNEEEEEEEELEEEEEEVEEEEEMDEED